jgi:hypothetical protein
MFARAIRKSLMRVLLSDLLKTAETSAEANALAAGAAVLRLLPPFRHVFSSPAVDV